MRHAVIFLAAVLTAAAQDVAVSSGQDPLANSRFAAPPMEAAKEEMKTCYDALSFGKWTGMSYHKDLFFTEQDTLQFEVTLNNTKDFESCKVYATVVQLTQVTNALILSGEEGVTVLNITLTKDQPTVNLTLLATFVGYVDLVICPADVSLEVCTDRDGGGVSYTTWNIPVYKLENALDKIFDTVVVCLLVFANLGIGFTSDFEVIKGVLKRPIAPVIGLCCQFIIMPLAAFGITSAMNLQPQNLALGFLVVGCSPGGGGSNFHTFFLGGDLNLSVTMTFVSTIAAVGMMPLWLLTLGQAMADERTHIEIPFTKLIMGLVSILVPFTIGLMVRYKFPKFAKKAFDWFVQPFMALVLLYLLTAGVYTNLYLFYLMSWKVILTGAVIPYIGFFTAAIVAKLMKQTNQHIITIAIETGIQNTGIAMAILKLSFEPPDKWLTLCAPVAQMVCTPIPLLIAEVCRFVYLKIYKPIQFKRLPVDETGVHGEMARMSGLLRADETRTTLLQSGEGDSQERDTPRLAGEVYGTSGPTAGDSSGML